MKREENMKFEKKKKFKWYLFKYLIYLPPWLTCKVSRKYSHAFLSYSAKTKRDGQTDGRTDGQRCNISRPRAYGAGGR